MPKRRFAWKKDAGSRRSDLVLRSGLPAWVTRVLRENGVRRMSVIAKLSDTELLEIPGIGPRALEIIRLELARSSRAAGAPVEEPDLHP